MLLFCHRHPAHRGRAVRIFALMGLASVFAACAAGTENKRPERQFYKNPYVRRCLQYDKEQLPDEARVCWARLLRRVQGEPGFKEEAKFTDADVAKMRQMSSRSIRQSEQLQEEREACLNIPASKRDERIRCFQEYLEKHKDQLTRSQRYEIENAVTELRAAKRIATGAVEATIQRAGKLLGAQLHEEKPGVRIDSVEAGPMQAAGVQEQGIIVAIDGTPLAELHSAERIAKLESCEDAPIVVLVRHGGIGDITFTRAEVCCRPQATRGRRIWEVRLPQETCSTEESPEIGLGISWCYLARDGVLEVEEVCADTPAAVAGVLPGHRYVQINGEPLLGKTYLQIAEIIEKVPDTPLRLEEASGALQSPAPIKQAPLASEAAGRCWRAVRSVVSPEDVTDTP